MPKLLRLLPLMASLLAAPAAAQDSTVVILVRHAEKAVVPATDNDPPLSEAGAARAVALRQALEGRRVDAVIATNRQRTQATARPLAEARGMTPRIVSLQHGRAHVDSVAAEVRRHVGHTVLVVGHSNTVPAIIAALGGPRMPELCETEYANLYVLVMRADAPARLERRTYGAADPPGAAICPPHP